MHLSQSDRYREVYLSISVARKHEEIEFAPTNQGILFLLLICRGFYDVPSRRPQISLSVRLAVCQILCKFAKRKYNNNE